MGQGTYSPMAALIPPQTLPLLILLLLLLPLTVLTGESLILPVIEGFQAGFTFKSDVPSFPISLWIKLIAFVVLVFLGFYQLLLRISTNYLSVWSTFFPRPDPLHMDYHPNPKESQLATVNWHLYRGIVMFGPIVFIVVASSVLTGLSLLLLTMVRGWLTIGMPLQMTVGVFAYMLLGLLFVLACGNAIWTGFISLFGSPIAVTEPELSAKGVLERCNRIAFSSSWVWLMYPAFTLFGVMVALEVYTLCEHLDIQDVIGFSVNWPMLLLFELLTLVAYLGLNFCRFFVYHDALQNYYAKLPRQFKDHFEPPPPMAVLLNPPPTSVLPEIEDDA
jgi:hypothetical protein